jgi:hypothetical protein
VAALEGHSRRRLLWIGLPAAAAAIVLAVALPRWVDEIRGGHRGPPIPSALTPRPVAPVGTVASAATLRWTSVAGANRYRITVFDAAGRVLYETQLADTVVTLPDSITLVPGRPYLWMAEARAGWDRWSTSELVQFSIASGAQR